MHEVVIEVVFEGGRETRTARLVLVPQGDRWRAVGYYRWQMAGYPKRPSVELEPGRRRVQSVELVPAGDVPVSLEGHPISEARFPSQEEAATEFRRRVGAGEFPELQPAE